MINRFDIRAVLIGAPTVAFWLGILFLTADGPLSPTVVVGILIAMTLTLYRPIRHWRNAWLTAALFSGVIAFLALWIAAAYSGIGR